MQTVYTPDVIQVLYYTKTGSIYSLIGDTFSQRTPPGSYDKFKYSDPKEMYHLPVSFPDSFTDSYASVPFVVKPGTRFRNGYETVTIDGYGTVINPDQAYIKDCLRLKIVDHYTDSFSITDVRYHRNTTYTWVSPSYRGLIMFQISLDSFYSKSNSVIQARDYAVFSHITADHTGFPSLSESVFSVFPNPTQGELNVVFQNVQEKVTLKVIDLAGKESMSYQSIYTSKEKINTSQFSPGFYTLEVETKKGKRIRKFIVM